MTTDEIWEGGAGSDDVSFRVGTGWTQEGRAGRVEVWAGDEMDPAGLTPEAARRAADEWPAILRRLADEAELPRCAHGLAYPHVIAREDGYNFPERRCPGPAPKEA